MFKKLLFFALFFVLINSMAHGHFWRVYPTMSLPEIQAVVDSASNGDTVVFYAGIYDWSGAPLHSNYANEGAIKITDKTLTIKGKPGNLIKGPDTIGDLRNQTGSNAFYIQDEDTNNDVTFDGLNIEHFMRGIAAFFYDTGRRNYQDARNVTVKNCSISDMARGAISIDCAAGDILIQDNTFSQCNLAAIGITYLGQAPGFWQPDDSKVNIRRNKITECPWMGMHVEMTKNFRIENNSIALSSPSIYTGYNSGPGSGIYILGAKRGTRFSSNSISNYPIGISVDGLGAWDGSPSLEAEDIVIKKNKISCVFYDECYGISLCYDDSSGHTVTGNTINLTSVGAVGIYSETNHNYYGRNKISGSGRIGVWLSGKDYSPNGTVYPAYAHHESFEYNDLCGFTPSESHYYLDSQTHDNSIIGSDRCFWTYADYGTNNTIINGVLDLPDLVVTSLTGSVTTLQIEWDVWVKNVGSEAVSGESIVNLTAKLADGTFVAAGGKYMGSLAPGESFHFSTWQTRPEPFPYGEYRLCAEADGEFQIPESNENNNATCINAVNPFPDLVVSSLTGSITRTAGSFTAVVRNDQLAVAGASKLRMTLKRSGVTLAVKDFDIPSLGYGDTYSETFSIVASIAPGTYYLYAYADATFIVTESNESNNEKWIKRTVL